MFNKDMHKEPFDIDLAVQRIRVAVQPFRKAAMFELYELGYTSLFEQLVACMISIRTLDEATVPIARRLFEKARSAQAISQLDEVEIDRLIHSSTFHERKASQILTIARRVMDEFQGDLPCDRDILLSFPGIGIKCANLALGVACGQAHISVDVHVHRIANRWGYIHAATPEKSTEKLEAVLPAQYWIEINRLLVPFGKHICTGVLPHCSTCPVLSMCEQIGVEKHR